MSISPSGQIHPATGMSDHYSMLLTPSTHCQEIAAAISLDIYYLDFLICNRPFLYSVLTDILMMQKYFQIILNNVLHSFFLLFVIYLLTNSISEKIGENQDVNENSLQ